MSKLRDLESFMENPVEYEQAQDIIQRLMAQGFIQRDFSKSSKQDYDFILRHIREMQLMVGFCGFRMIVVDAEGKNVVLLGTINEDSKVNRVKFNKEATIILLRLLYAYKEKVYSSAVGKTARCALIKVDDLLTQLIASLGRNKSVKSNEAYIRTLKENLYLFQDYQMVIVQDKKKDFNLDTSVTILSTIASFLPDWTLEEISNKLLALEAEGRQCVQGDADAEFVNAED